MLARTKKTIFTIALATAALSLGLRQPAWGQAAQPQWKDRAEFDLYDAITKETQPAKRIELLNQWKEKYPASEFGNVRIQVYAQSYQQAGDCANAINSSNELLGKDANNLNALNVIMTCIYTVKDANADQLGSADKAASQTLANIGTLFDASKKPQGVTDDQWKQAQDGIALLAQNTLGYTAMQQKNYTKAEDEFTKSLKMNPKQGQVSYWLGTVVLAQKDPNKQSPALWQFARAASYDAEGALPPANRTNVKTYLEKAYVSFHGDKSGLDDLLTQAKASPFPPTPDWKLTSRVDIEKAKIEQEQKDAAANPQLALWKSLRDALTGAEAQKYFDEHMKGAELPPFKGKLIEARPEMNPKELVLSVGDGTTADATLKLDAALRGKMEPGAILEFSGIASGYTASPFMVNFEVDKTKLSGWKGVGGAPAPPAKKAPARPAVKKK